LPYRFFCFWKPRFTCQNQTEIQKRLRVTGVIFRGLPEEMLGLLVFPLLRVKHAQIALRLGVSGIERDRSFQFMFRLRQPTSLKIQESQLVE
jgi:hypothetical protein